MGLALIYLALDNKTKEQLALDLAIFLKQLQGITRVKGIAPGQHNFWRGDHIGVYDQNVKEQISKLSGIIDICNAKNLWQKAGQTKWCKNLVWIHGDLAIGNILIKDSKLSGVIDFGGTAMGDPACDLTIAWTYFQANARQIFIREMNLDEDTWLRAKAWTLWKASYELCQIKDRNSLEYSKQIKITESLFLD